MVAPTETLPFPVQRRSEEWGCRSRGLGSCSLALWLRGSKGCMHPLGRWPQRQAWDRHRVPTEAFSPRASRKFLADGCVWPSVALPSCVGSCHLFPDGGGGDSPFLRKLGMWSAAAGHGRREGACRVRTWHQNRTAVCSALPCPRNRQPLRQKSHTREHAKLQILSRDQSSVPYPMGGVFPKGWVSTRIQMGFRAPEKELSCPGYENQPKLRTRNGM